MNMKIADSIYEYHFLNKNINEIEDRGAAWHLKNKGLNKKVTKKRLSELIRTNEFTKEEIKNYVYEWVERDEIGLDSIIDFFDQKRRELNVIYCHKIVIKNFKKIENVEFPLDRINIVVGGNSSGKSSLLQAIQFGNSVIQSCSYLLTKEVAQLKRVEEIHKKNLFEKYHLNKPKKIPLSQNDIFYSPYRQFKYLFRDHEFHASNSKYQKSIGISYYQAETAFISTEIAKNSADSILPEFTSSDETTAKNYGSLFTDYRNPFCAFVPGVAGIPTEESFVNPGRVFRSFAKGDSNNYFRNIIYQLKNDTKITKIRIDDQLISGKFNIFKKSLERIFGKKVELIVDFNQDESVYIEIYAEVENGVTIPIDAMGTGFLQTMHILSYILLYQPKLIILDEPDSHLHPNNLRRLIAEIYFLSHELNFQVLMSTHSRVVIDEVKDRDNTNLFWFDEGFISDGNFNQAEALFKLGALDALDSISHKTKLIVMTEDKEQKFIRAFIESFGLEKSEYDICSFKGCTNLEAAKGLSLYLKNRDFNVKILIHRDRDYLSESSEIIESFKKLDDGRNIGTFIPPRTDIESIFLDKNHIRDCIEAENERLARYGRASVIAEESKIDKLLIDSMKLASDESISKMISEEYKMSLEEAQSNLKSDPERFTLGKSWKKKFEDLSKNYLGINRMQLAKKTRSIKIKFPEIDSFING